MHKLIINADDFGYSRAINHAVIDTHREGILTSTTLMTNTTSFEHAVKLAKETPTLGVGVHLVLTHLKPLRDDVPSLIDDNGNFYRPDAYRAGLAIADLEELYKEWDTQIQKMLDAGLQPTHLDSHHHVHTLNEHHQDVILNLAKKYDLPVRGNLETDTPYRTTSYFEPSFDTVSVLDEIEQAHYLEALLERMKEYESTEVMCHVGYIDEELLNHSSFIEPRMHQVELLIDSAFVDEIRADKEIELVTFREI